MDIWQIKQVKLGDLIPNAKNPRKISQEKLAALQDKIERLGFHNPIKTDEHMQVLGGNQRLKALLKIAGKDLIVPVMVPNRPLTEEEKQEVIITDNIADGQWDWEKLSKEWDKDLTTTWGLDWTECDFDAGDDTEQNEIIEDELPEEVETRCKRGDIWQIGEHRLMCGDSTCVTDVEKLMNGEKADLSFQSPPYNVGHNLGYDDKKSKYINNDDNSKNYLVFLKKFTEQSIKYSKFTFVNIQQLSNNKIDLIDYLHHFKNELSDTIIWDKGSAAPAMAHKVMNSVFEYIYIFSEKATRSVGVRDFHGTVSNIIHISKQNNNEYSKIHNATFPIQLPVQILENFTNDKSNVLDLFGGTGTTLIACEQLNRKCFMMELDEHYCDVIIQRWENLTGQKAKLLS